MGIFSKLSEPPLPAVDPRQELLRRHAELVEEKNRIWDRTGEINKRLAEIVAADPLRRQVIILRNAGNGVIANDTPEQAALKHERNELDRRWHPVLKEMAELGMEAGIYVR